MILIQSRRKTEIIINVAQIVSLVKFDCNSTSTSSSEAEREFCSGIGVNLKL